MEWDSEIILEKVRRAAGRVVFSRTENVLTIAVRSIQSGSKTGRMYQRRGVTHQASAPGQSPASDTGRLVQSGRTSFDQSSISGRVTFSTEYAELLELGTEKIEPRPFLRPALAEGTKGIEEEVNDAIKGELG